MDTRINTDLVQEPINQEELQNFIKFDDDNPLEEALIASMISAVRSHFERRTGLAFAAKTLETQFRSTDRPFILPVQPVISVDKVETIDSEGIKTELTLNSDYYKRGLYEVEIRPIAPTTNDLLVTYQAGYGSDDTQDLPQDLRYAMMAQVKQWYDNRDDFYEFKILGSIERILYLHKTKLI